MTTGRYLGDLGAACLCFLYSSVLQEVLELISGELDARGVTLETELANDLPPVLAGRVEVQQVLMNLLLNALRALWARCNGGASV